MPSSVMADAKTHLIDVQFAELALRKIVFHHRQKPYVGSLISSTARTFPSREITHSHSIHG